MINQVMQWVVANFVRKRDLQALLRMPGVTLLHSFRVKRAGAQGSVGLFVGNTTQAGYIEWRLPHEDDDLGTRLGYMGWHPDYLNIRLENGFPLVIDGGVTHLFPVLPRVSRQISNGSVSGANAGTLQLVSQTGTADDLDTITGVTVDGQILVVKAAGGHVITAKDNTGNMHLEGDFVLNTRADRLTLQWDNELSKWCEIARANGV